MQHYTHWDSSQQRKDNARWYILEGQRENDDFVLFGIVVGLAETEYSYISANEMAPLAKFCQCDGKTLPL